MASKKKVVISPKGGQPSVTNPGSFTKVTGRTAMGDPIVELDKTPRSVPGPDADAAGAIPPYKESD